MEKLIPFSPTPDDLSVQAEIRIEGTELHARYVVSGSGIKNLHAPKQTSSSFEGPGNRPEKSIRPQRADELWKTTCFELFLSVSGQGDYYELNFSPSGNWNAYHFDSYREGMKRESRIETTEIKQELKSDRYELQSFVDLSALLSDLKSQLGTPSLSFDASMTAVIQNNRHSNRLGNPLSNHFGDHLSNHQDNDAQISYWALQHARPEADFHWRESFTLKFRG
jgi:hypothetical protein